MSFRTMQCPSCEKQIQVPTDVDTAICMYCGYNIVCSVVSESYKGVNIENLLGLARSANAGNNLQEAEKYYTKVLEIDPKISEAWIGKGTTAGWQSSLVHMRFDEMLVAFKNAIATAPDSEKEATLAQCLIHANAIVSAIYKISIDHLAEFASLQDSWDTHIQMTIKSILFLDEINSWGTQNKAILENIVELCKDNIDGFKFKDKFDNNISKVWTIAPEYETLLRSKMESAIKEIKRIDPNYIPPKAEQQKPDTCFVVTATMGNPQHPLVVLMRDFRDTQLVKTKGGQKFIVWYYKHGPKFANIISKNSVLRFLSFTFIVVPASWIVRIIQRSR